MFMAYVYAVKVGGNGLARTYSGTWVTTFRKFVKLKYLFCNTNKLGVKCIQSDSRSMLTLWVGKFQNFKNWNLNNFIIR